MREFQIWKASRKRSMDKGGISVEEYKNYCDTQDKRLKRLEYATYFLKMSSQKLSNVVGIAGINSQIFDLNLSFSQYRQWQIGLVNFLGEKEGFLSTCKHVRPIKARVSYSYRIFRDYSLSRIIWFYTDRTNGWAPLWKWVCLVKIIVN